MICSYKKRVYIIQSGYKCNVASSPREVVEECDVIVSALPKPVHIKEAFEGDDGILAGMSPGN